MGCKTQKEPSTDVRACHAKPTDNLLHYYEQSSIYSYRHVRMKLKLCHVSLNDRVLLRFMLYYSSVLFEMSNVQHIYI